MAGKTVTGGRLNLSTIIAPSEPDDPLAPTGLSATPGNKQVGLSWNSSSGATSYSVMRALVNGGPYAVIGCIHEHDLHR